MPNLDKGLDGVVVAETEISDIDGEEGSLSYRGYAIEELADNARFEEVAYLLWHGDLPTESQLDSFKEALAAERTLPDRVRETLQSLAQADADPMVALRTAVSMLSSSNNASDNLADLDKQLVSGRHAGSRRNCRRSSPHSPGIAADRARCYLERISITRRTSSICSMVAFQAMLKQISSIRL